MQRRLLSERGDFDEISRVQREGAVDSLPKYAHKFNRVLSAAAAVEGGIVIAGAGNAECFIVIKIGASAQTRVCRAVIDGLSIAFLAKVYFKEK